MRKIKNLKSYLLDFYQRNRSQLIQDYSGINERIFLRSFLDGLYFIHQGPIELDGDYPTEKLDQYLAEFETGKPIAYIFGMSYFLDFPFLINQNVLIPRFETELLVELAQKFIEHNKHVQRIADIGCGPGTIGLSLLRMVQRPLELHAYDISSSALEVFEQNRARFATHFHSASVIKSFKSDRLNGIDEKYHLIVSNPPYIKQENDLTLVHKNVQRYEPAIALFLPDEIYLKWFQEFFAQVDRCLLPGGQFIMEGHEHHLEELAKYLPQHGRIEFYLDLSQSIRGLIWHKNGEMPHG